RLAKGLHQQRAVFEDDDIPAEGLKQRLKAGPQAFADDRIEALAVVVDDPPAITQVLLPAFEDGFEDIALIELGVTHERNHAPFGLICTPAMGAHVILHEAGKERLRDAQPYRSGGEVDVVGVLGARGIALRALVAAEELELLARLPPEEILDGVIN